MGSFLFFFHSPLVISSVCQLFFHLSLLFFLTASFFSYFFYFPCHLSLLETFIFFILFLHICFFAFTLFCYFENILVFSFPFLIFFPLIIQPALHFFFFSFLHPFLLLLSFDISPSFLQIFTYVLSFNLYMIL